MSAVEATANDGSIHPFVYYQKPVIGADTTEDVVPIQTVFPSGGFAIGVPVKFSDAAAPAEEPGAAMPRPATGVTLRRA